MIVARNCILWSQNTLIIRKDWSFLPKTFTKYNAFPWDVYYPYIWIPQQRPLLGLKTKLDQHINLQIICHQPRPRDQTSPSDLISCPHEASINVYKINTFLHSLNTCLLWKEVKCSHFVHIFLKSAVRKILNFFTYPGGGKKNTIYWFGFIVRISSSEPRSSHVENDRKENL